MRTNKPLVGKTALRARKALRASTKPKRRPKPSLTLLKHKADALFSRAIRLRDGERRGDGSWWVECITCSERNPIAKTHAGHFQPRGRISTRWEPENVNGQCPGCNTYRGGEQYKYSLAIDLKYGDGTALKLFKLAKLDFRPNREFLEDIIATAQEEIKWYENKA